MRLSASSRWRLLPILCATLATITACSKGDKSDKPADKSAATKPADKPAAKQPARDDTTSEGRVATLTAFRDRVCKCTDEACANKANIELRTWLGGVRGYKMDNKVVKQVRKLIRDFQRCQKKLTGKMLRPDGTPGDTTTKTTDTKMPAGYDDKVKAYMTDAAKAVTGAKGDCGAMAKAMANVITAHGATIKMIREQQANPAVKTWTAQQTALNEQGKNLGRALGKCATTPQMRAVLNRLRGVKR